MRATMNGWIAKSRTISARQPCGAFTLVELLVVVAIIALLAALIFPTLAAAKTKARRVECLNHLRQWTLAFRMYTGLDEHIPREGHHRDGNVRPNNWAQIRDPANRDVWYNALPPQIGLEAVRAFASSLSGAPARFYGNRLYHCPSAQFYVGVERDTYAYFSLAMNSKLILPPNPTILAGSIQRPADTVLFLDGRVSRNEAKVDSFQPDTDLGQPSVSASRFAARHGRGGCLAFSDGHAAWWPGEQVVETRNGFNRGYTIFPPKELCWTANPSDHPDIRGD